MEVVKALLRFVSYLFHGLLALFLLAVSGLALASGSPSLRLDMLPWTGSTLVYVVFFSSLVGLASVLLAMASKLRLLFFLWSLVVLVLMFKGFFFSSYHFAPGGFRIALYLMGGAVLGLAGSWFQLRRNTARSKRF